MTTADGGGGAPAGPPPPGPEPQAPPDFPFAEAEALLNRIRDVDGDLHQFRASDRSSRSSIVGFGSRYRRFDEAADRASTRVGTAEGDLGQAATEIRTLVNAARQDLADYRSAHRAWAARRDAYLAAPPSPGGRQ